MRISMLTAAVTASVAGLAQAQLTDDWPTGEILPYVRDSGVLENAAGQARALYQETVRIDDAAWVRVYFDDVQLGAGSFVRITSLLDGEVQVLDAAAMTMWGNASAYFNGDSVTVELIGGAKTAANRLAIGRVATQQNVDDPGEASTVCGVDNRISSNELWTARLVPAGCTASVWSEESCMITAGHCIGGNMVVHFNVPPSQANCNIVAPPISDQFPVSATAFLAGGLGNDWAVLAAGTNNLGEKPYDRYGDLRVLDFTPPVVGQTVTITGYGVDTPCPVSQTQQTDSDPITSITGTRILYFVDTTGGVSGSAIIRNGRIIGVHTNSGCPNSGTRLDVPALAAALGQCPPPDPTPIETGPVAADDAYLLVSPDGYGAWAPPFGGGFGPNEDRFNPAGAPPLKKAAFTAGTMLFSGGVGRALLATSADWHGALGSGNLSTEITSDNVASDTNSDGVDDTLVSSFTVSAGPVSLLFDLTQHVEELTTLGPTDPIALLTQQYTITNDGPDPIDIELVRMFDGDLTWSGDFMNDSVGTGTNASAADRFVFEQEPGDPSTAITISSPQGAAYFGGKHGIDPDGPGGSPEYAFGTDVQVWNAFGVPNGWRNHIAGVGYDTDGESGASPAGSTTPFDGFIGLEIPVSLGAGETKTVTIYHTWGDNEPAPVEACPWDCDGNDDGIVNVTDLLALLAQYDVINPPCDAGGTCDFDGNGCVDVADLLKLLAHYDPLGVGCP